ncbi:phosphosulfolactate synthase [Scopulibacillus daqui]|uniref:Phosphosulfolactate synthase n=1 Tax=Scopulibacillus daqui TaxID=1469162 RepID=A0ABS2PXX6_9BACL|nr:phosphosulfolactate synthase [Scopulibacillus daqui]MBM7644167.1 phosphosulfolactate synthase [Scopulibacillus daqui]
MGELRLPYRTKKNRTYGITSIVDFGIPLGELKNILSDYHEYIDMAKIGIGSAYVTPHISEKINIYQAFNVIPYCGGTLFEKFYSQNKLDKYLLYLKDLNVDWIEISTGILDIPLEERLALVQRLKKDFKVIGEVGSKDTQKKMAAPDWNHELTALLDAGCQYVITEGRDSGTAGIYRSNGQIKENLIFDVIQNVDCKRVIFEAPHAKSQMFFINQIGANANLGNVKIHDVLLLEAQRLGLRSETFFMEEKADAAYVN